MRHMVIAGIGLVLFAMIFAGMWATVIFALRSGQLFVGTNYKGLPLGTYTNLAVLIVATMVLVVMAVKRIFSAVKHRRSE